MFCRQCGKEQDGGLPFCTNCGAPLAGALTASAVSSKPGAAALIGADVPPANAADLKVRAVRVIGMALILVAVVTFLANQALWPLGIQLTSLSTWFIAHNLLAITRDLLLILLAVFGLLFAAQIKRLGCAGSRFRMDSTGDLIAGIGLLLYAILEIVLARIVDVAFATAVSNYSLVLGILKTTQTLVPMALLVVASIFYLQPSRRGACPQGIYRTVTALAALALLVVAAVELFQFILPTLMGAAVTSTPEYLQGYGLLELVRTVLTMGFAVFRGLNWQLAPSMAKKLIVR